MSALRFILNIPWTIIGLCLACVCLPQRISFNKQPFALIIAVRSLWLVEWWMRGVRAVTVGHVVLLSRHADIHDRNHELIHVRQYQKEALIHPILYSIELAKNGYRASKYEIEAYEAAGSKYIE